MGKQRQERLLVSVEEQSLELRHSRPGTFALLMCVWTETSYRTKTGFMETMAEQSLKPHSKCLSHMTIYSNPQFICKLRVKDKS